MRDCVIAAELLDDDGLLGVETGFPDALEFVFDPVFVVELAGLESVPGREIDGCGLRSPLAGGRGEEVFSDGEASKSQAVSATDTEKKGAVVFGDGDGDGAVSPILDELVLWDVVFLLPAGLHLESLLCCFSSDERERQGALRGKEDFSELEGELGDP